MDDEYDEIIHIIPNSEYSVMSINKKGYKGWVALNGIWKGKQSIFADILIFSPSQYKELIEKSF